MDDDLYQTSDVSRLRQAIEETSKSPEIPVLELAGVGIPGHGWFKRPSNMTPEEFISKFREAFR